MRIKKVMVIGSGLMGSGITQVCAQAGIEVFMNDVSQEALSRAVKNICSGRPAPTPPLCASVRLSPPGAFLTWPLSRYRLPKKKERNTIFKGGR